MNTSTQRSVQNFRSVHVLARALTFLVVVALCPLARAKVDGGEVGGGGYGWRDTQNKLHLYDFVEAGMETNVALPQPGDSDPTLPQNFITDLPEADVGLETYLRAILRVINNKDPATTTLLQARFDRLEFRFISPSLAQTRDLGATPILIDGISLWQVARQDLRSGVVSINRDLWNELETSSKVGLILHEVIYSLYSEHYKDRNSKATRDTNIFLFSRKLNIASPTQFLEKVYRVAEVDASLKTNEPNAMRREAVLAHHQISEKNCSPIVELVDAQMLKFGRAWNAYLLTSFAKMTRGCVSNDKSFYETVSCRDGARRFNSHAKLMGFYRRGANLRGYLPVDEKDAPFALPFDDTALVIPTKAVTAKGNLHTNFDGRKAQELLEIASETKTLLTKSQNFRGGYCIRAVAGMTIIRQYHATAYERSQSHYIGDFEDMLGLMANAQLAPNK